MNVAGLEPASPDKRPGALTTKPKVLVRGTKFGIKAASSNEVISFLTSEVFSFLGLVRAWLS